MSGGAADARYWAEHYAQEYYDRAKQYREEAARIRSLRDQWIAEGRPENTTAYMYREYCDDDGRAAIRRCLEAAEYQEQRAKQVYQETLEEHARQEQVRREEERRQAAHQKADEMLDDWFKKNRG